MAKISPNRFVITTRSNTMKKNLNKCGGVLTIATDTHSRRLTFTHAHKHTSTLHAPQNAFYAHHSHTNTSDHTDCCIAENWNSLWERRTDLMANTLCELVWLYWVSSARQGCCCCFVTSTTLFGEQTLIQRASKRRNSNRFHRLGVRAYNTRTCTQS